MQRESSGKNLMGKTKSLYVHLLFAGNTVAVPQRAAPNKGIVTQSKHPQLSHESNIFLSDIKYAFRG